MLSAKVDIPRSMTRSFGLRSAQIWHLLRGHSQSDFPSSIITTPALSQCLQWNTTPLQGGATCSHVLLNDRSLDRQSRCWSTAMHVDGSSRSQLRTSTADTSTTTRTTLGASTSSSQWGDEGGAGDEDDPQQLWEDRRAEELRQQLLQAALGHVKEKGWTVAALQAAAQQLGLSPSASGMVSNGAAGLVEHFMEECNQRLAEELESRAAELAGVKVGERVRLGVRTRLEMIIPYIDTWPQAMGIQASPPNVAAAVRQRAELVDDIWHAAGDTSTDYNWYTKRGLLAGVYTATELFMLTDYSPGYADTWQSLDRRLHDVRRLGGAASEARQFLRGALDNMGAMAAWAQETLVNRQQRRQQQQQAR